MKRLLLIPLVLLAVAAAPSVKQMVEDSMWALGLVQLQSVPLSDLARRTQELDHRSTVALAQEHFDSVGAKVIWKQVMLVPDARKPVFTVRGAFRTFQLNHEAPRRSPAPVCMARGPEGWLVWENGECGTEGEWAVPVLPQTERQKLLVQAMMAVAKRQRPQDLPLACAGLAKVPLEQVGYVDWNLHIAAPAVLRTGAVNISSAVVETCPAHASPWNVARGGCGLDAPWKYVVVFDLVGSGYDRATAKGGRLEGVIEVVDVARGMILCRRALAFAALEPKFEELPRAERDEAMSSYGRRAYATFCSEVSARRRSPAHSEALGLPGGHVPMKHLRLVPLRSRGATETR